MVFSDFTRTESGNQIIFKTSTPIEYVEKLKYFRDNASGSFSKKEYRWSFNGHYWANWEVLNQGNISGIIINNNKYLLLEIRYTKSNPSASVSSFQIGYNPLTESERTPEPSPNPTAVENTPIPP